MPCLQGNKALQEAWLGNNVFNKLTPASSHGCSKREIAACVVLQWRLEAQAATAVLPAVRSASSIAMNCSKQMSAS